MIYNDLWYLMALFVDYFYHPQCFYDVRWDKKQI